MLVLAGNDLLSRYAGDGRDMVLHDQVQTRRQSNLHLTGHTFKQALHVQHIPVEDSKANNFHHLPSIWLVLTTGES